jgi:hypothetical protein
MKLTALETDDEILWQVGWDDSNIPAFGLDFFEEESEAEQHSEALSDAGETGIVLTKLKNDIPTMTWKLVDGDWE